MAQGLLNSMSRSIKAYSAGMEATIVRPEAIAVMKEIGIDISHHTSKHLQQYLNEEFDEVITVCDSANGLCPVFPNAKHRLHWSIDDPTRVSGSAQEVLDAFRKARDELKSRIQAEFKL